MSVRAKKTNKQTDKPKTKKNENKNKNNNDIFSLGFVVRNTAQGIRIPQTSGIHLIPKQK